MRREPTAKTRASLSIVAWRLKKNPRHRQEHTVTDTKGGSGCPTALDFGMSTATDRRKSVQDEHPTNMRSRVTASDVDSDWAIEILLLLGATRAPPFPRALDPHGVELHILGEFMVKSVSEI
jgi:hypothetical protein